MKGNYNSFSWNIPRSIKRVRACIIVAHPDDETVFMGGTILRHRDWDWKIISVTSSISDKPRGTQFALAMEAYKTYGVRNIVGECLGMGDEKGLLRDRNSDPNFDRNFSRWTEAIAREHLNSDVYFTHNSFGEYGHSRHKIVHLIMTRMFKNVWEFLYPRSMTNQERKINLIRLTKGEIALKNDIFKTCYISEQYLWENLPDLMNYQFKEGAEGFYQSTFNINYPL